MNQPTNEVVESIAELERRAHADISPHERAVERITRRLAHPGAVYSIVAFAAVWIGLNAALNATHRVTFDVPPYPLLQSLMTFVSLLLVVLILTTGNRVTLIELRRSQLDLQINLLTERRTAKLIDMLDALRRDLPQIPTHDDDAEVNDLRTPSDPHQVARDIEQRTPHKPRS